VEAFTQRTFALKSVLFVPYGENGEVELVAHYAIYKAPTSGKTISALIVLRDVQSRPWTPNIGGDALPAPDADLKRFCEQGVAEFFTGRRR
jgi:putative aldouronate transport system substrate-binding protein